MIRFCDLQIPEEIGIFRVLLTTLRHVWSWVDGFDAHRLHHFSQPFPSNANVIIFQFLSDAPIAIERKFGIDFINLFHDVIFILVCMFAVDITTSDTKDFCLSRFGDVFTINQSYFFLMGQSAIFFKPG